jgi:anti-anti-sigma regulatory factor
MTRARSPARMPARVAKTRKAPPAAQSRAVIIEAPPCEARVEELINASVPASAPVSPAGLKLEPSCTLRDSIDMQFQLLAVDFGNSDVVVDGSAVERIDTAGLQMLLAFAKHQASRGKALRWSAVSPELTRGSQLLGLAALLGLPESNSGSDARGD